MSLLQADSRPLRVALVGFGEAGSILGEDLALAGCEVSAWDSLLDDAGAADAMRAKVIAAGVEVADSLARALDSAALVIAAVTASASEDVARDAGVLLQPGQVYMDINSVSPATRQRNAQLIEASGAVYLEAAVMAPVPPSRLAVTMLLGGAQAEALVAPLRRLGMNVTAVATNVGKASAVKMCRSIVIKGLEALTLESMLAARAFGVEDDVLQSLQRTFPQMGWLQDFPDYEIGRVAEHGLRRAAEMNEVARTLQDIGMTPTMAAATAPRQQALVEDMRRRGATCRQDAPLRWRELADRLAAR